MPIAGYVTEELKNQLISLVTDKDERTKAQTNGQDGNIMPPLPVGSGGILCRAQCITRISLHGLCSSYSDSVVRTKVVASCMLMNR